MEKSRSGGNRRCEICGMHEIRNNEKLFFTKFPLDVSRCREWLRMVGNEELTYLPLEKLHTSRNICGMHFEKRDFNKKGNRLKRHAIPTLNISTLPLSDNQLVCFPMYMFNSEKDQSFESVSSTSQYTEVIGGEDSFKASKRRLEEDESSTPPSPSRKKKEMFDFKNLCLFCGEESDQATQKGGKEQYKYTLSKVSTLEFKDNIIEKAEKRNDSLGNSVRKRILYEHNLIDAGAKYHDICYSNFIKNAPSDEPRPDDRVTQAMNEIFSYIRRHKDSQFTLEELRAVPAAYVPDDNTIVQRLQQKYLNELIITRKTGSLTIISLRDTPANKRLEIVETAASIIREDIRSCIDAKSRSQSRMPDGINKDIPKTLSHFLHEVIFQNKKGKLGHLKKKCTSISQAIMASLREAIIAQEQVGEEEN